MALTLPYPTYTPFTAASVHSASAHNTPHAGLLSNDEYLKTQIEANTALITSSAFDWTQHVLSINGYQKFPEGLIVQWAVGASMPTAGATQVISWPTSFTSIYIAMVSAYRTPPATAGYKQWFIVNSYTASSVTVLLVREETQPSGPMTPHVLGVGYKS